MKSTEFNEKVLDAKRFVKGLSISTYSENISFYQLLQKTNPVSNSQHEVKTVRNKELYFVDGSIGSGKSTIMKSYIVHKGIEDLVYYSPEAFLTITNLETDFISAYNKAKKFLWEDMRRRLNTGGSLIVEAVFTKEEKIDFLAAAKKEGYFIIGVYVGTSGADINIRRVNGRVNEGGFEIPLEKILDRYNKSLRNFARVFDLSDELVVLDNSDWKPSLVAYKFGIDLYLSRSLPTWAKTFLPKAIKTNE